MSALVLKFPDARSKKEPPRQLADVPRMYCTSCDGIEFAIFADGNIHCRGCWAHIKNLRAVQP
jgi:hypothetical protein